MTRTGSRKFIYIIFFSAIISIAILFNLDVKKFQDDAMTNDLSASEKLFKNAKILCFGRFLMRVPENSNIVYGPVEVDGELTYHRGEAKKIEILVSERLRKIDGEKKYIPEYEVGELPMIGNVVDGVIPGQKIVFGASNSSSYAIYSFIPLGEDLFVHYSRNVPPEENELPLINKIASQLSLRSDQDVPGASGFCVEGGFLSAEPEYENIAIGLNFKDFPDVRFSIDMRKNQNYLQEESSLQQSRQQAKVFAENLGQSSFFSKIKTLREGTNRFGVWSGDEMLTRRPAYKDDIDAHEFRFFSVGSKNDAFHPSIDVRLDTGVKGNAKASVKPSISDEDALAIWDKLLSTIRVRQPSDASSSKDVKPTTPLGAIISSGDICPQTGLWECTDKRKIDGNRRRQFKEGDKIPPVIVTGHISLLRTLIGDVYRVTRVEWQLVACDTSPVSNGSSDHHDDSDSLKNTHA